MARTSARLPKGTRITDFISLGVIAKMFPVKVINEILHETDKQSVRQRNLPAHVVVYYVISLALYMSSSCREVLRCLLEGVKWLAGDSTNVRVTGRAGISQARARLGQEPMKRLHDRIVIPIATTETKGAWYQSWHLVSIDGSTLDVADTKENVEYFDRPVSSRGESAFPQLRMVSLVENGTHVLFGTRMGSYRNCSEQVLAKEVICNLTKGMLCMADRNFFSYEMWNNAAATGADLLWRAKTNLILPCIKRFDDGSYLSKIYPSAKDRRHDDNGVLVRVIEYKLKGVPHSEPLYRLLTTIIDPKQAPANELAALYHDRWEIESAFDELKTHLRGAKIVLRSKRPELVCQEFWGFMLAYFAIRGVMHEAAVKENVDPDVLSFVHTVRVIRRKLPLFVAFPPSRHSGLA